MSSIGADLNNTDYPFQSDLRAVSKSRNRLNRSGTTMSSSTTKPSGKHRDRKAVNETQDNDSVSEYDEDWKPTIRVRLCDPCHFLILTTCVAI